MRLRAPAQSGKGSTRSQIFVRSVSHRIVINVMRVIKFANIVQTDLA